QGAGFRVPEPEVMDAERSLAVQNLELSWRYSIGNAYEESSFPESLDQAQVRAEVGFEPVAEAIVRVTLNRRETPYPGRTMGARPGPGAGRWARGGWRQPSRPACGTTADFSSPSPRSSPGT